MQHRTTFVACVLLGIFSAGAARGVADPDEPLSCKILKIKSGVYVKILCKGDIPMPSPENAPTAGDGFSGADLGFDNVGVGGEGQGVAKSLFVGIGRPPGSRGYRARNGGVCPVFKVTPRRIRITCRRASTLTALPLPVPSEVFVRLTLYGNTFEDSKTYCLSSAGSAVRRNTDDKFVARDLPAPASCAP